MFWLGVMFVTILRLFFFLPEMPEMPEFDWPEERIDLLPMWLRRF
jgi:hypothetical protein